MTKKNLLIIIILFAFISLNFSAVFANDSNSEIKALNTKAEKALENDYKASMKYSNEALALSKKTDYKNGMIISYNNLGMAYLSDGNYKLASGNFSQSLELNKGSDADIYSLAVSYNGLGLVQSSVQNYDSAFSHFSNALKFYKDIKDKQGIANSFNNLGSVEDSRDEYSKALNYYIQSLKINEELKNSEEIATCYNNIGFIYSKLKNHQKSLDFFLKSLKISEDNQNNRGISIALNNIADLFSLSKDYENALYYYSKSLEINLKTGDYEQSINTFNNLGLTYEKMSDYKNAILNYNEALTLAENKKDSNSLISIYNNLGTLYYKTGDDNKALDYYQKSLAISTSLKDKFGMKSSYENISYVYKNMKNYQLAFTYHEKYTDIKDALYQDNISNTITDMETKYDTEKKEKEISILSKENEIKTLKYRIQLIISFVSLIILIVFLYFGYVILKEKKKSEQLLLNILPVRIASQLKKDGKTEPEWFDNVTIFFSDIVGFTNTSSKLDPKVLINELNDIFTSFDNIMEKHSCERIKTIGDAYFAVCGLPIENVHHAANILRASIEIIGFINERNKNSEIKWEIRVGVHSGKVVGGVVGVKKYIYDLFGDTVNTASRMESYSEPMKINVSEHTYELVKDEFSFIKRDSINVKGKDKIDMYFLDTKTD